MAGISSGWGKEDDCVMVRLYLPGRPNLVNQQVKTNPEAKSCSFAITDIEDLLIGVHLAVISEAMAFCERLGLDVELMFDIVSNAAGSSAVFVKTFDGLRTGGWSLKAVHDVERIQNRLVSSQAYLLLWVHPNLAFSPKQSKRLPTFAIHSSCHPLL